MKSSEILLYTGVLRDFLRDERFFSKIFRKFVLEFAKSVIIVANLFPYWEWFIPNLGTIH